MTKYDAIVLGTGGVGSAALFHLALRGRVCSGLIDSNRVTIAVARTARLG